MSKVIEVINAVHANCDVEWLTDSQRAIYEQLINGFNSQRVLNVFGDAGVGKTLLAWVMERTGYGTYCPDVNELPVGTRRVLVDNFPAQRRASRRLIDRLNDVQVAQAVLFTQRRIDDDLPVFHLTLTSDDLLRCRSNLFRELGVQFLTEDSFFNLHDLVRSVT